AINVHATDDVGIDSLHLRAFRAASTTPFFDVKVRQPPYQFVVTIPAFDASDPTRNVLRFEAEAIDTYGAAFGDLDAHVALESINAEITTDEPPTVAIGLPANNAKIVEGQSLLVQLNAIDDV